MMWPSKIFIAEDQLLKNITCVVCVCVLRERKSERPRKGGGGGGGGGCSAPTSEILVYCLNRLSILNTIIISLTRSSTQRD